MDPCDWIERHLQPVACDSAAFMYDEMESQSGRCLPLLYRPFDLGDRMHWSDRGWLFDFLHATGARGGRLLDFGPGDGWPSLILAPFLERVVGVDASPRRVEVCRDNARRLGVRNAEFVHVPAGARLPFDDAGFDGAAAASSLEQTPDPAAALAEIRRVLRPGGRLRMHYEDLERYRGGRERELGLHALDAGRCALDLYDRDPDLERARIYRLVLALPEDHARALLGDAEGRLSVSMLTGEARHGLAGHLVEARRCTLIHPAAASWIRLCEEAGFSSATSTHAGARLAARWFERLLPAERPADMESLDRLLDPAVAVVVGLEAPLRLQMPVTAVK